MITLNRITSLFLIIAVLLISFWAARYALADFYYERANTGYKKLDLSTLRYAREFDHIESSIDRSLALRWQNSNTLDFKANLLYQSWWLSPDAQYLQASQLLQAAMQHHINAQAFRQNWSFSAARLALIYSHQVTLESTFEQWFKESHRLGLYETAIARSLMLVGLQNWSRLSPQQQSLTIDFIRTSIEQKANSPEMMIALLDRYQLRRKACDILLDTPRMLNVC